MGKLGRILYLLWEVLLVIATMSILTIIFLFPSAPEWVSKILWIVFGYLLSNVLNYVLSELKPTSPKVETISEFSLIRKDVSGMKSSLKRIETKLDKSLN
jgi:hypothetical protein